MRSAEKHPLGNNGISYSTEELDNCDKVSIKFSFLPITPFLIEYHTPSRKLVQHELTSCMIELGGFPFQPNSSECPSNFTLASERENRFTMLGTVWNNKICRQWEDHFKRKMNFRPFSFIGAGRGLLVFLYQEPTINIWCELGSVVCVALLKPVHDIRIHWMCLTEYGGFPH